MIGHDQFGAGMGLAMHDQIDTQHTQQLLGPSAGGRHALQLGHAPHAEVHQDQTAQDVQKHPDAA